MAKNPSKPLQKRPFSPQTGLGFAYRLGLELMSGILVGLLLGYAIDRVWGTQPWGLVMMVLLGSAAGLLNIFRILGLVGTCRSSLSAAKRGKTKEEKMVDPLHQFKIHPLIHLEWGGWDISFTNSSLFMVLATLAILLFFSLSVNPRSLIPTGSK